MSENNDDSLLKQVQLKRKPNFDEKKSKRICRKETRRGLDANQLNEAEYYFEDDLRKVYPYHYTYSTFCKGRWVGKPIIDVFSDEFHAHSKEEYEKNILAGNIKINGETISSDYVLKENDCVTNKAHRHEIAVAAAHIQVIHSDDNFVVIDKPPSIPVHPCGRYRHNSLLFILAKEHGLTELYSVHRLDRLTSGMLLFTKTLQKSQEVNELIRERKVEKEYVCRVEGKFPEGIIECEEPLEIISNKMGISMVSSTGKECKTIFEKMSFNGKSSVICCKPKTGRMHQIRVHLQYLGYPIINDPIYNHDTVFGPKKGKNGDIGKTREQLLEDLLNTHNLKKWLLEDGNGDLHNEHELLTIDDVSNRMCLRALDSYLNCETLKKLSEKYVKKPEKLLIDETCELCRQKYMDPQPKDLIMFLHALRYSSNEWMFETKLPTWAKDDWKDC